MEGRENEFFEPPKNSFSRFKNGPLEGRENEFGNEFLSLQKRHFHCPKMDPWRVVKMSFGASRKIISTAQKGTPGGS